MVNIIIPVYNGLNLLATPLDSLVKLKLSKDDFIVTIILDYDELDYSYIINEYKNKGLNIDFHKADKRIKLGKARQIGIDSHPEADYIMFLDLDDEYLPETILWLYNKIKSTEADVVFSNFVKETADGSEVVNQLHAEIITLLHGKIYSTEYLNRCEISFSEDLSYAEDSYFNLMAFYCTLKIGYIDRVTYNWNYNEKSESNNDLIEYYKNMYSDYILGQAQALMHINKYNKDLNPQFIASIIVYFYHIIMVERAMNFNNTKYRPYLLELGKQDFVKDIFKNDEIMLFIANMVKGGQIFKDQPVFFNGCFTDWLKEWLED